MSGGLSSARPQVAAAVPTATGVAGLPEAGQVASGRGLGPQLQRCGAVRSAHRTTAGFEAPDINFSTHGHA